jgi:S1-C subfamily serine protease
MTGELKPCIACAEDIKAEAVLCRFCGTTQTDPRFIESREHFGASSGPTPLAPTPQGKMSTGLIAIITLGIIAVFGAVVAVVVWLWWVSVPSVIESSPRPVAPSSAEFNIAEIYDAALPSIVTVYCGSDLGSGFAYDVEPATGFRTVIVTNEHVIFDCTFEGGPSVSVETYGGQKISGSLWSWDADNDLAIIMIRETLPPLIAASPASIGDPVLVMGTPGGLQGSVTTGIISQVYTDAYQTDAAMNRGNSGGPLLDRNGRVLGVNTLGLGREGLNIAFRVELLCDKVVSCG